MPNDDLTLERLPTAEAVLTLGALAVRILQEHGIVTLFMNKDSVVEICAPGELELDALPEEQALERLLERNYSDKQLIVYLKGREARAMLGKQLES